MDDNTSFLNNVFSKQITLNDLNDPDLNYFNDINVETKAFSLSETKTHLAHSQLFIA